MTDARTGVSADHEAEPIDGAAVPVSPEENSHGVADFRHQSVVSGDPAETTPAVGGLATGAPSDPATSDASSTPQNGVKATNEADTHQTTPVDADTTLQPDASPTSQNGVKATNEADAHPTAPVDADTTLQPDADTAPNADMDPAAAADAGATTQGDSKAASHSDSAAEPSAAPPLRDPDDAALRLAEAAVFASATPMTPRALSQILPDDVDPAAVIAMLRTRYEGRGLELIEIGGGLQFRTAADLAPQLRKVVQVPRRLPRVALETLAIVAYHQPITRPEIEDLRGTGLSQQTLDTLLENDLIVARGRKETPGRPTLWGTTAKFLEYFGLRDIRELPRRQDLLLEAIRPEGEGETPSAPSEDAQSGPPDGPPP